MNVTRQQRPLVLAALVVGAVVLILFGTGTLKGKSLGNKYQNLREIKRRVNTTVKRFAIPAASLKLTEEQEEKLCEESNLKPMKSRGATIFVDKEGNIRIPPDSFIDLMTVRDMEELYHRYIGTIQTICKQKVHLGKIVDGGYDICQDKAVAPTSKPCLMYSFGVRDDFQFDEEVRDMYGCEIHTFDPANGMKDHKHSDSIYFHSMGIGGFDGESNNGWKIRTFATVKKELGHSKRKLDILKIDMKGGEWSVMNDMLNTNPSIDIKQLIVKFHTKVQINWGFDSPLRNDLSKQLKLARQLYDLGFRIFFHRRFHQENCCYTGEGGFKWTGCMDRPVELIKIDVESGEWPSFEAMARDGMFKDVKQMVTELHTWVDLPPDWTVYHRDEKHYRQHLKMLRIIYEQGLRIFFLRRFDAMCCMFNDGFNNERTGCNEVHFMRVNS